MTDYLTLSWFVVANKYSSFSDDIDANIPCPRLITFRRMLNSRLDWLFRSRYYKTFMSYVEMAFFLAAANDQ